MEYFPVHAHSEYSILDGMGTVEEMVELVASMNQPGIALTDHGNMAGAITLYKTARKHDIVPFPGEEFYLVQDVNDKATVKRRYHLVLLALNQAGFETLIKLSSLSHKRERFHLRPLIDFQDLYYLKETGLVDGIAALSGCYFGWPLQKWEESGRNISVLVKCLKIYRDIFPHFFAEVQFHGHDIEVASAMVEAADALSIPMVFGQDSHYCSQYDHRTHDFMKDICYFGDSDDNRFPGGPYHLANKSFVKSSADFVAQGLYDDILLGHDELLELNTLRLPELDNYKFHVPNYKENPNVVLRKKSRLGLKRLLGDKITNVYLKQLEYEFKVISKMGMANYFLIVQDYINWAAKQGIVTNVRGSANGSLVCYALGITHIDPILWNLSFDRFLSLDRQKPPDIDLDIEHERRNDIVEYLRTRFPTMVQIGTYQVIGISPKTSMDELDEDRGSVYVQYVAAMKSKDPSFDGKVKPEHRKHLERLSEIHVRKSAGAHAGGFVVPGDELPIEKYLATMLIPSSNTTVTQATMESVESAGYVKFDLLGLRTLTVVKKCFELIASRRGLILDIKDIPFDDKLACRILSSGIPNNGIFQFEGWTTAKGAHHMKIRDTRDAILCLALYRPALMQGGQTEQFLRNRASNTIEKHHPVIDPILDETFGVPVFQEQVIEIMRTVGLPYDDLNAILKAVKASNNNIALAQQEFARVEPIFMKKAAERGIYDDEADLVWNLVKGFSDYGFNRAHATAYGVLAYRSAWLKAYYPSEYMAALLSVWAGTQREAIYLQELRRMGLQVGKVNVNKSDIYWTLEPSGVLRKGFLSLKGVGLSAANKIVEERTANGDFVSLADFIDRCQGRSVTGGKDYYKTGVFKGVMKVLHDAGALSTLPVTR